MNYFCKKNILYFNAQKVYFSELLETKTEGRYFTERNFLSSKTTYALPLITDLWSYWFYCIDKMPVIELRIGRLNLTEGNVNKDIATPILLSIKFLVQLKQAYVLLVV